MNICTFHDFYNITVSVYRAVGFSLDPPRVFSSTVRDPYLSGGVELICEATLYMAHIYIASLYIAPRSPLYIYHLMCVLYTLWGSILVLSLPSSTWYQSRTFCFSRFLLIQGVFGYSVRARLPESMWSTTLQKEVFPNSAPFWSYRSQTAQLSKKQFRFCFSRFLLIQGVFE